MISSAYAKRGLLYNKYKEHFGHDDPDTLVIKASTLQMNPSFNAKIIARDLASGLIPSRCRFGSSAWSTDRPPNQEGSKRGLRCRGNHTPVQHYPWTTIAYISRCGKRPTLVGTDGRSMLASIR
jgi:hypothetical protein